MRTHRIRLGFMVILGVAVAGLGAGVAFGGDRSLPSPPPIAAANVDWLRPDLGGTFTYPDGRRSLPAAAADQARVRVTSASAIQKAEAEFQPDPQVSQTQAALRIVTNPVMAGVSEFTPINDRLVWVVTYRNSFPFLSGPKNASRPDPSSLFCVFVVLVDASSGDILSGDQYCRGANGQE